ncbi:MAG: phosphatidate cytidylyltransferase [Candidatus Pelagibacter sp.]
MSNLSKRFATSILLLLILYFAIINQIVIFILLITVSFFVLVELFNLNRKIFRKKNILFVIVYLVSIIYLSLFFTQIYFFMIFDLNNKLLFLYLLSVCIATDLGGYVCGKIFQGKKLTKISPNKTYSGLIGSYLFSLIVFILFYFYFNYALNFIILTLIVSSISQLGDLFISWLKRMAKVKDTGQVLIGHGGILDRFDGILFALPIGINLLIFFK